MGAGRLDSVPGAGRFLLCAMCRALNTLCAVVYVPVVRFTFFIKIFAYCLLVVCVFSTIYCLLSTTRYLLPPIYYLLPPIYYLLPTAMFFSTLPAVYSTFKVFSYFYGLLSTVSSLGSPPSAGSSS